VAIVAADLFFRFVEAPSHRLAKSVGRRLESARRVRTVAADAERA
jgi:hypothetical protein